MVRGPTEAITLVGMWERGWFAPLSEVSLWEFLVREYRVNSLVMAPVSGISNKSIQEIPEAQLGEFLADSRGKGQTVVFVDEGGSADLLDFQHPAAAVYVVGKTTLSPMKVYGQENDLSVKVPTPSNLGMLWGHQAALLALHDRFVKGM